jgi:hypothetical protein
MIKSSYAYTNVQTEREKKQTLRTDSLESLTTPSIQMPKTYFSSLKDVIK